MKVSKTIEKIKEVAIATYKGECPYCLSERMYRFDANNLPSGAKCKCCKEWFALRYEHHEGPEDELWNLLECNSCGKVHNFYDIRESKAVVTKGGEVDVNEACDCGGIDFKRIELEGI